MSEKQTGARRASVEEATSPGARHEALAPLVGDWRIEVGVWPEGEGGPKTTGEAAARKRWINGGRHVREEVEGSIGGKPHEKLTVLGYNNLRQRYEFITADNADPVIVSYQGHADASGRKIELFAEYVFPGYEPEVSGELVVIRSVFEIENGDRHRLRIHYTHPASEEYLFLEYAYVRSPEAGATS